MILDMNVSRAMSTSYSTPNLSKMAADGAQFNNAHAQNICNSSSANNDRAIQC